jgi:hypothetical protein
MGEVWDIFWEIGQNLGYIERDALHFASFVLKRWTRGWEKRRTRLGDGAGERGV